jgi:hypothetical protein
LLQHLCPVQQACDNRNLQSTAEHSIALGIRHAAPSWPRCSPQQQTHARASFVHIPALGLPQDAQRLMVDFADYPGVLLRALNASIREPAHHLAVLVFQPSGEARLDFIQVGGWVRCCMGGSARMLLGGPAASENP